MVIIKGSGWKWVSEGSYPGQRVNADIELLPPTWQEIKKLSMADFVLLKRRYSHLLEHDELVSILKEEGEKGCEDDKVQDLLKQISDITEKIVEHQNDISNAIIQFLKSKEK